MVAVPSLDELIDRLDVRDSVVDRVLRVIGLVLTAGAAAKHLGGGGSALSMLSVVFERQIAVEAFEGRLVLTEPGTGESQVVPGRAIVFIILDEVLKGRRQPRQLGRRGSAGKSPVPGSAA